MSGITGLGTNYNLPNYTGILYQISRMDTPLFSAIGGLTSGRQATSVEFEWQASDLRKAVQSTKVEGANAPTATQRVRQNYSNVCQIHQSKVSVSYSKLAAIGQKAGVNNAAQNPITNELDWQVQQELLAMALDIEFSFINGVYVKPNDNSTARQTKGLIAAIDSANKTNKGTESTGLSASTDTISETTTARSNGDKIVFTSVGASTTLRVDQVYYVVSKSTDAFKVAETLGGSPVTIGTATVAYTTVIASNALSTDTYGEHFQRVYDAGGLSGGNTVVLLGSTQKRNMSNVYASAWAKATPVRGNIAGVNVTQVESDFGILNLMLDRYVPPDAIVTTTLDELAPVFLETPGKGHFFAEPLAKTGSSDDVQLYGEVGLAFGAPLHHGVLRGLPV